MTNNLQGQDRKMGRTGKKSQAKKQFWKTVHSSGSVTQQMHNNLQDQNVNVPRKGKNSRAKTQSQTTVHLSDNVTADQQMPNSPKTLENRSYADAVKQVCPSQVGNVSGTSHCTQYEERGVEVSHPSTSNTTVFDTQNANKHSFAISNVNTEQLTDPHACNTEVTADIAISPMSEQEEAEKLRCHKDCLASNLIHYLKKRLSPMSEEDDTKRLQWLKERLYNNITDCLKEQLSDIITCVSNGNDEIPMEDMSYADAVKVRYEPGISPIEPDETRIAASHSQNNMRYDPFSRNKQCGCNALIFLAFLHENEHITSGNLDLVLQKGDTMYKEVRRQLDAKARTQIGKKKAKQNVFLATDELPNTVCARSHVYKVTKHCPRCGTFGDPPPDSVDEFLDLEAGLSCLLTEVNYALLTMRNVIIAVFRNGAGHFGFFDPHTRGSDGLPVLGSTGLLGTAVMLTFTTLKDMIDRIVTCHNIFETPSTCKYELTPIEFHGANMDNSNATFTDSIADPSTQAGKEIPTTSKHVYNTHNTNRHNKHSPFEMSNVGAKPEMSYTDAVKQMHKGIHEPVTSQHIQYDDRSDETRVAASHSQDGMKYNLFSRNKQCSCNSLTFLAFLHENEHITPSNLDLVLHKGDVMYTEVRRQLEANAMAQFGGNNEDMPHFDYLATDELPNSVCARSHVYNVQKHCSRHGTLFNCADDYLDLEAGLSCLLTEVNYALLVMSSLVIAVFRNRAGHFGFFDPHSRGSDGLPVFGRTGLVGTAVMLTFTKLKDMIDRIIECHIIFDTLPTCEYELMPVEFHNANVDHSDVTITDSIADLSPQADIEIPTTSKTNVYSTHNTKRQNKHSLSKISSQKQCKDSHTSNIPYSADNTAISTLNEQEVDIMSTVKHQHCNESSAKCDGTYTQLTNTEASQCLTFSKYVTEQFPKVTSMSKNHKANISKLPKARRKKFKRRAERAEKQNHLSNPIKLKKTQRKETKNMKERINYVKNAIYQQRKKSYKKSYIKDRFMKNIGFKIKQMQIINQINQCRYRNDLEFKLKKTQNEQQRIDNNPILKLRHNEIMRKINQQRYKNDLLFRHRHKEIMKLINKHRYQNDLLFRHRHKEVIQQRYKSDLLFRHRHKEIMKLINKHRYRSDPDFRQRHLHKCSAYLYKRYHSEPAFRLFHKMRCTSRIKQKYTEQSARRAQIRKLRSIQKAISDFRKNVKDGPTHVCTVCHRALFPKRVNRCNRKDYVKNPNVVSACLTGTYVHVCDDECRDSCTVPDERKQEWICPTCHDHLVRGNMPPLAMANNLGLVPIPPELSDLNILERHISKKYITFGKIIPLPKGQQRLLCGNVVCVPSNIERTVNTLPRLRSESQVMRVKLKRRLCFKGHQLFQTVTWTKVLKGLRTLKQIHPEYRDITIRDETELCDPTIHDEEEGDNQIDDIMADDEYGDDDLMDIDRCEQNALNEPHDSPADEEQDIDSLPCNDNQQLEHSINSEQEGDQQTGGIILESCLQPIDFADELLTFSEGIYNIAPAEGNKPVNFFRTPKLESMAFPVQFPTSVNTFDDVRPIKLTPSSYFKSRLMCVDGRFARDTEYLFFAQVATEIHLATSSMTIQLRKGKPLTRDGRKITARMLQDNQEVLKLVRNRDAVRFMQPLRGTPPYWDKTTRDLFATIRQIGKPTWFSSFSAAEMRWPEMIVAIKKQQGEQVNFEELDWPTKCKILRSNPVTTMRMFDKRVDELYKFFKSAAQPLGKLVDFFYRLEWQHRGSPHIHSILWIDGAPVYGEDSYEAVCNFIDMYVTARLPDPKTEPELYKKVKELQTHSRNHSKTCRKNNRAGCRFGFPKPPASQTMITAPPPPGDLERLNTAKMKLKPVFELLNDPKTESLDLPQLLAACNLSRDELSESLDALNSSNTVILKRDPKDCMVNPYNPHVLDAWDANMDLQYILNVHSCIMYMTGYITKAEHGMSEYLKTMIENSCQNNVNTDERGEMMQVMQAYTKKREVSAQECVARVCGLKMKMHSRVVRFIPTSDNRLKMSYPRARLENSIPDTEDVWMTGLIEKYYARPEEPDFEEMCLADFAATCNIVYGQKIQKLKGVLPLLDDMGFVQKRTGKPAIIRYHRTSQEKNPEEYFGTLLKLYLPHRSESQLKSKNFPTYQSFLFGACVQLQGLNQVRPVGEIVKENRSKYEKHSNEVDSAIEEYEQNGPIRDEWCNLAPESELVRLECIAERETQHVDDQHEQEDVPDYCVESDAGTTAVPMTHTIQMNPVVLRQMYQNLNLKQACIFYTIRDWCIKRVCNIPTEQFFLYVNGGAGTGKSHLIKCIHAEASKILSKLQRNSEETDISMPTVLLTAFTGTAAFNISGQTLHSIFKLPRFIQRPFPGLGNKLDLVRAQLSNAEIIVIDEVSMVSKTIFAYVDERLKQIKGSQKPFGGMSVLAVGDFYQLPPISRAKPLCVYEPDQTDLWRDQFQMITLTEIMRQKDDIAYAEMLNRMRVKQKSDTLSEADRALLSQAITEPALCPIDALHIFPRNRDVDTHNDETLKLLHSDITIIDADDYKQDRSKRMVRQEKPSGGTKQDLEKTLKVAVGARVMITRNIDVDDGLVNGTFGKIAQIVTCERDGAVYTKMLGLELDNENAGQCHRGKIPGGADNVVYIERVEEKLRHATRKQFPIKLAFACTVHKVQGMTTSTAVVSLNKCFADGMAYVALSRVSSLAGLHIIYMDESSIFANPEITAALESMTHVSFEDVMPLAHSTQTLNRPDTLTIIHHNTEGLAPHINDIKSHHELCLADVLCLTETHLQGSSVADSLLLEGYNMFRRNRHVSYSNNPCMANTGGGGVAVYVKNHLQARWIQYIHNVTDLEFVVVKVEAPVNALIAAVYRPPNYSLKQFLPNLKSLLDSLEVMDHHPTIVCGDFNENLLSSRTHEIFDVFESRGYAQLITAATTEKNTLLDHIFISRPQHCVQSGVLQTYHSYHNPVYCIITSNI